MKRESFSKIDYINSKNSYNNKDKFTNKDYIILNHTIIIQYKSLHLNTNKIVLIVIIWGWNNSKWKKNKMNSI
jgi:hypothetical protein